MDPYYVAGGVEAMGLQGLQVPLQIFPGIEVRLLAWAKVQKIRGAENK